MRTGSFIYLLREGLRNISQNRLMSVATVGTLLSCLLLIGCSVLFSVNVNSIVGYFEAQNELSAFLVDDLTNDQIDAIEAEIWEDENVASVQFIHKDTALQLWMDTLGDSGELYQFLKDDNPLPHSFQVRVQDLEYYDVTVMNMHRIYGIERIRDATEVAEAVSGIKTAFTAISMALILILVTVSLVIVANTIRITVFSRRREISIMRYVGATNVFIRLPFLFEGVLLGLLAGLLAFLIIWGGYATLIRWFTDSMVAWVGVLSGNVVPFKSVALPLFGGFMGAGAGIGALGSMLFIGKHIKV